MSIRTAGATPRREEGNRRVPDRASAKATLHRCVFASVLECLIGTRSVAIAGGEGARGSLMRTGTPGKGRMSRFRNDQEERDFWARHSVEEFAEELQDLDVAIRPPPGRTEQIAVRLSKDDLQAVRSLAAERGVSGCASRTRRHGPGPHT